MTLFVGRLIERYARVLAWGGLALAVAALGLDRRWIDQPLAVTLLLAAIAALRATPVRLSKYSYLTQIAVPELVGAVAVGPSPVVIALILGIVASDVLWLRKPFIAGLVNAGREVIAFTAAFGVYAAILRTSGTAELSFDALPALFSLLVIHFLVSRLLFYFSLLVRAKLEKAEQLLILRWEIVSYLMTAITCVVVVGSLRSLAPEGWLAVLLVLGGLGALSKRILEEAIAAEDLNKVHSMESTITGNLSLHASLEQIERVGYRLLEWGDFRIYRRQGDGMTLLYRGAVGQNNREDPPTDAEALRAHVVATGEAIVIRSTRRDPRILMPAPHVQSMVLQPVRFGDEVLGTVEVDHWKQHVYGGKELAALATLATQVATAIHIAELRRPLVTTVEQIAAQVEALERATNSLRRSAVALTSASRSAQQGVAEQETIVASGFEAIASVAVATNDMAVHGRRAADASRRAAEVAGDNRAVIGDAIQRLVSLESFVGDSTRQVAELGQATRRVTGLLAAIREIADLTSLLALNAAIEAARAGQEGRGFAIVAEEVRELAAQSMQAARDAGSLIGDVLGRVDAVSGHMERGREVVTGVGELSADAAEALDGIVGATGEAGSSARWIAEKASAQELALQALTDQIERLAAASSRTRSETESLAAQAREAGEAQAQLEGAIGELGEVAAHLRSIARHFAVDT